MNKKYLVVKYGSFVLGMAILSFGLFNIHDRCSITEGGVLGAVLLIQHWTGISPSISSLVMDSLCFLFGTLVLGRGFLRDSIIAAILFSVWYAIFERIGPVLPDLTDLPLLAAIFGALFVGVGVGMTVIFGGACGGDDALALAFHKLLHVPVASVYFVSDTIILLLSLSYIPVVRILWSLLSVSISSLVIQSICWISGGQTESARK